MASNHSQQIVQKLRNYCNVLRDDGVSCGERLGQFNLFENSISRSFA